MPHPLPANEPDRLRALERFRTLGESAEDAAALDRLVQVARGIFDTPIALVSLMGADRQWFEARVGIDMGGASRDASLCAHVVASGEPLVVPDAARDPRFAASPLVAGAPDVRFYAGAPLLTEEGHAIGALCVIDTEPRPRPDAGALEMLRHLAGAAVALLRQRTAALRDRTSLTQREAFDAGQNRLLALVAEGEELPRVLEELARFVEGLVPGLRASALLLSEDGERLEHGAAPSLPEAYCRAIDGTRIGPRAGSCGTAAYTGEFVEVADIATDPRWADYRDLALPHGLRACWSMPIRTDEGRVLGTFALYYEEARLPSGKERDLLRSASHLAAIAIERHRREVELVRMRERLAFLLEASPATIYASESTPPYRATFVSPNIEDVLGYSASDFLADPAFWPSRLHPEEVDAVMGRGTEPAERPVIEYRFRHADGRYRWLRDRIRLVEGGRSGRPELVGYLQDVTEERTAREEAARADERAVRDYAALMQRITALAERVGLAREHADVYRALFEFARASTPADGILVAHFDPGEELRRCVFSAGLAGDRYEEDDVADLPPLPLNDSPQSRAIRERRTVVTHDLQAALSRVPNVALGSDSEQNPAQSSVAVPMLIEGEIMGVFELQSVRPEAFHPEHASALQMAANLAAIAAKNVQLLQREKRARRQAEAEHARLRDLTEQSPALMATVEGPEHVYTAANALYLQTVGKRDILGQRVVDVLPEVEAQGIIEILDRVYRTGESVVANATPVDLDTANTGELQRLYLNIVYQALRDADGVVTGVLVHVVNVTEQFETRLELERLNTELRHAYDRTIEGWARALDLRDEETAGHSQRVTDTTVQLARRMGVSEEELEHIRRGALLHDIGKMGVPDSILLKPGKLTPEEWEVMKRHTTYARDLLAPIEFLRPALAIPYGHHERWDGGGYPRGLRGEEIPLTARIFAVVDVLDALTSDRPYRAAWPAERALAHIREQAGRHFDPAVVEAFLELVRARGGARGA